MKKCLWIITLLSIWILPASVMADTTQETKGKDLEEMVVTASRTQEVKR